MNSEIKQIRKSLNLTQEELANRLGVRTNTVWRWENQQAQPSELVRMAIKSLVSKEAAQ